MPAELVGKFCSFRIFPADEKQHLAPWRSLLAGLQPWSAQPHQVLHKKCHDFMNPGNNLYIYTSPQISGCMFACHFFMISPVAPQTRTHSGATSEERKNTIDAWVGELLLIQGNHRHSCSPSSFKWVYTPTQPKVCMYVCLSVCTYIRMYVCTYVRM